MSCMITSPSESCLDLTRANKAMVSCSNNVRLAIAFAVKGFARNLRKWSVDDGQRVTGHYLAALTRSMYDDLTVLIPEPGVPEPFHRTDTCSKP